MCPPLNQHATNIVISHIYSASLSHHTHTHTCAHILLCTLSLSLLSLFDFFVFFLLSSFSCDVESKWLRIKRGRFPDKVRDPLIVRRPPTFIERWKTKKESKQSSTKSTRKRRRFSLQNLFIASHVNESYFFFSVRMAQCRDSRRGDLIRHISFVLFSQVFRRVEKV